MRRLAAGGVASSCPDPVRPLRSRPDVADMAAAAAVTVPSVAMPIRAATGGGRGTRSLWRRVRGSTGLARAPRCPSRRRGSVSRTAASVAKYAARALRAGAYTLACGAVSFRWWARSTAAVRACCRLWPTSGILTRAATSAGVAAQVVWWVISRIAARTSAAVARRSGSVRAVLASVSRRYCAATSAQAAWLRSRTGSARERVAWLSCPASTPATITAVAAVVM